MAVFLNSTAQVEPKQFIPFSLSKTMSSDALIQSRALIRDLESIRDQAPPAPLSLSALGASSRALLLAVERRRQRAQAAGAAADARRLRLQNLRYERAHLLRQIQRCRDFPAPEFDRAAAAFVAPELTLCAAAAHPAPAWARGLLEACPALREGSVEPSLLSSILTSNAHDLVLARLQHEREQRRALERQLEAAKRRALELREKNRSRLSFADTLPQQHRVLVDEAARLRAPLEAELARVITRALKSNVDEGAELRALADEHQLKKRRLV
jgi:hypothetical protein